VVEKVKRAGERRTLHQPGPNELGATSRKVNQAPLSPQHLTEKGRARTSPKGRGKEKVRANPRERVNTSPKGKDLEKEDGQAPKAKPKA
jgi:hypothetical protein